MLCSEILFFYNSKCYNLSIGSGVLWSGIYQVWYGWLAAFSTRRSRAFTGKFKLRLLPGGRRHRDHHYMSESEFESERAGGPAGRGG